MKIYFEKGDNVRVMFTKETLHANLHEMYQEEKGRTKIVDGIHETEGVVLGVVEGRGHIEVLYQPNGKKHSWIVPTSVLTIIY